MEFDKEFSEYKGTYAERYIDTDRILTKAKQDQGASKVYSMYGTN